MYDMEYTCSVETNAANISIIDVGVKAHINERIRTIGNLSSFPSFPISL